MNQKEVKYIKGEVVDILPVKTIAPDTIFKEEYFPDYIVKTDLGEQKLSSDGANYKIGDKVYVEQTTYDGETFTNLGEKIRTLEIVILAAIFLLVVFTIFGKKGLRALVSLTTSLLIIFFLLIPLTLKGYNPVIVAAIISTSLLACMMLITHGRNKITYAALLGCSVSVFITILFSYILINISRISGFVDDASSYIKFGLDNPINLSLLVIASFIIGVIGAIDDGAITQANVVNEIKVLDKNLSKKEIYEKAMNVGRAHGASMVNTLVLAYIASALPLMILFYTSPSPWYILINSELIATEIFRSLIGSIGLLLAIPLTTLFAIYIGSDNSRVEKHYH